MSDLQKRQVTLDSCNRWSSKTNGAIRELCQKTQLSRLGNNLSITASVGSESTHGPPLTPPPRSLSSCALTNAHQSVACSRCWQSWDPSSQEFWDLAGPLPTAPQWEGGNCWRSPQSQREGDLGRFTPLPAKIYLWNKTQIISIGSTVKYLLLLFQLVWFYVPFVYWIVNGVYFPPIRCTLSSLLRIHERINLFTMKNRYSNCLSKYVLTHGWKYSITPVLLCLRAMDSYNDVADVVQMGRGYKTLVPPNNRV